MKLTFLGANQDVYKRQHGGFGLGIDRLTMLLCGQSIKDAEFLFRGPNRLTP